MKDILIDEGFYATKSASLANAKEIIRLKGKHSTLHSKIKNGRIALGLLVILTIISSIAEVITFSDYPIVLITDGIYVVVLIAAWIVAKRKPFVGFAMAVGMIVISSLLILFGNPIEILRGLLLKVIFLYFIVVAMMACKKYLQNLKDLKAYGVVVEGSELVD